MTLFVTSFTREMYEATGAELLSSFVSVKQRGHFFVGYEGKKPKLAQPNIDFFDLAKDSFLRDWLEKNKDIIPVELGGTMPDCKCPGRESRRARHLPGCRSDFMNRNASRFFRKVVTLRLAVGSAQTLKADKLLWLDSDCILLSAVEDDLLRACFRGTGCFYLQGLGRRAVESGVMGFDLANGGTEIINRFCDFYASGEFRECKRWDDGYLWTCFFYKYPELPVFDLMSESKTTKSLPIGERNLAAVAAGVRRSSAVLPLTPLGRHIEHRKGTHSKKLDIMR